MALSLRPVKPLTQAVKIVKIAQVVRENKRRIYIVPTSRIPHSSHLAYIGRMKSLRMIVIFVLILAGGAYAWTQTPSYSVYRIQQSLKTRDYSTFIQYVDVDSVVGHALEELGHDKADPPPQKPAPSQSPLADLVRKGLQSLARNVQDIAKAGAEFAVQQAFVNQDQELPQIPNVAVVGALVGGEAREGIRYFPVPLRNGEELEIGLRYTADGIWRVVQVTNVRSLLDEIQNRR